MVLSSSKSSSRTSWSKQSRSLALYNSPLLFAIAGPSIHPNHSFSLNSLSTAFSTLNPELVSNVQGM